MPGDDPQAKALADAVTQVRAQIDTLGAEYTVALEWGLFIDSVSPTTKSSAATELENHLKTAEDACAATPPKPQVGQQSLLAAREVLARERSRYPAYQANNNMGAVPIFFTVISSVVIYFVFFCDFRGMTNVTIRHDPTFWGFLGAILRSLYWMQFQINKGVLRPRWLAFFIVGPAIGTLLGAIATITVVTGAHLLTGKDSFTPEWYTLALVASYSGFQWQWALTKIEAGAEGIINRIKPAKA